MNLQKFQKKIWDYYRGSKRNLPWRPPSLKLRKGKLDPYNILVSEVMLQQTQISRVSEKYREFLEVYPTIRHLAKAPLGNVLRVWQGMGYNRRAIALRRLAEEVVSNHHSKIPLDFESLIALPGVGRATAGAMMAFASDAPVAFIETNIRRVFIHFFFKKKRHVDDAEILRLVAKTLPKKNVRPVRGRPAAGTATTVLGRSASNGVREWYWALMDYGAMLGANRIPNPNRQSAHYARQSAFQGSNRQLRGRILNLLLEDKIFSLRQLQEKTEVPLTKLQQALKGLMREGFLLKVGAQYTLAR